MKHEKMKESDGRPFGQPALVSDQAPTGLVPSGFDQAQTLDDIEAIREAAYAVIAADYYAGERTTERLATAAYAREDIDRAADKARDKIVTRVLASLGRKAA